LTVVGLREATMSSWSPSGVTTPARPMRRVPKMRPKETKVTRLRTPRLSVESVRRMAGHQDV
jgi:hypothetical protein